MQLNNRLQRTWIWRGAAEGSTEVTMNDRAWGKARHQTPFFLTPKHGWALLTNSGGTLGYLVSFGHLAYYRNYARESKISAISFWVDLVFFLVGGGVMLETFC